METCHFPQDILLLQRSSQSELIEQHDLIQNNGLLHWALDASPEYVTVLNRHRQIIFANQALLDLLGADSMETVLGKRPGEALSCEHAVLSKHGCGTTDFCSGCGAAQAITACYESKKNQSQECRITQLQHENTFDFRVKAVPFPEGEADFMLFYITDIAHEKRRRALERIFFHDVTNITTGLSGISRLLCEKELPSEKKTHYHELIQLNVSRLHEEIKAQRDLSAAESNELEVNRGPCSTLDCLREVAVFYSNSGYCAQCGVEIDPAASDVKLLTDKLLLNRIIGNMVKNGIEAVAPNGQVKLGCNHRGDTVEFWVHNQGHIPMDTQMHIFRRSFSTKGVGRGLGTYSIKLLGERYLGGQVTFDSCPGQGTTFRFFCPIKGGSSKSN